MPVRCKKTTTRILQTCLYSGRLWVNCSENCKPTRTVEHKLMTTDSNQVLTYISGQLPYNFKSAKGSGIRQATRRVVRDDTGYSICVRLVAATVESS